MGTYSAPGPRGLDAARIIAGFAYRPLGCYRDLASYGDAAELTYMPGRRLFILSRPEYVEHVLARNQDNYVKAFTYRPLRAVLGDGLLTSEGATWRRHRRVIQPMFSHRRVAAYAPLMTDAAERRIERWDALPNGTVIDASSALSGLTLDVVGRALFGSDLAAAAGRLAPALRRVQRGTSFATFFPYFWTENGTRRIVKATRGFWGTLDAIQGPVRDLIAERRRTEPGDDLLGLLMSARDEDGSALSDEDVRDEATTFVLAGHETTAVALSWTLALLSAYPAARERVEEESRHDDAEKLVWTKAVISEAMRLYPPAWTIERDALADDEIDGIRIPAGSTVATPPFLVHRHQGTWTNPEGFDPERFMTGEERHRYAYIPFGGGRRGCVGAGFAQLEAALLLSSITRRYRLDLVGAMPEPLPGVTLRMAKPLAMRLTRR